MTIVFQNQTSSIRLGGGNGGSTAITSYQRAQMADPTLTISEGEFYERMAARMMGNDPSAQAASGIKVADGDIQLTLGDGSRTNLTA